MFAEKADEYKAKFRQLDANLGPAGNEALRQQALLGDVAVQELCRMSSEDMMTTQQKEQREKTLKFLMEEYTVQGRKPMTTEFRCSKCGKRECSYYQMQTRSADEPMTLFIECCNCGNR